MSVTKVTGIAIVNTAEGLRIGYTYSKIDDNGNVTASNIRGSYIDESESTESFVDSLTKTIVKRIESDV